MRTVDVAATPLATLVAALDEVSARRLEAGAARARGLLADRRVWNVSATEVGGVGELLRSLLPYVTGAGVDVRWLVVDGDSDFRLVTDRLHHALHGDRGDGGPLGRDEMAMYDRVLAANLEEVRSQVAPGDVVVLHDPGTAGLAPGLAARGAHVVWRCHIGSDVAGEVSDAGWAFLEPSLAHAERSVFSRADYRPGFLDAVTVRVIAPSVDPLSAKNRPLEDAEVRDLLRGAGILAGAGSTGLGGPGSGVQAGGPGSGAQAGSSGSVVRAGGPGSGAQADGPGSVVRTGGLGSVVRAGALGSVVRTGDLGSVVRAGGPVPPDARVVLQLSRWNRLKDMTGLLIAFDEACEELPEDVHLLLAGADVGPEDTEGEEVLERCLQMWAGLEAGVRARVHVACLPDTAASAVVVNAVQRYATVVVQKSLAEGFGLTVAEALWKGKPVVATAVGGIQDQITDGENGLLVDDPRDLAELMTHVGRLLAEPALARQLGETAHARVRQAYLSDRHLLQYVDLIAEMLG
ncbi:glycosyltransferase [Georgenia muralis]|uniref:Trehalose synthase n=1 Tax=Georgenia muralis TaxID=154117 RepID=A0A3N4Z622_9MICO|nr:glycosyltransferase [Georgenia muralis]RPF27246.1 trehalose synthase [Georgenia muralis]